MTRPCTTGDVNVVPMATLGFQWCSTCFSSWWRHQMENFSALLFFCASLHKSQWRRALVFSLICNWTNSWANNRDTGDLRRNLANYDVIVLYYDSSTVWSNLWCDLVILRCKLRCIPWMPYYAGIITTIQRRNTIKPYIREMNESKYLILKPFNMWVYNALYTWMYGFV